MKEWYKFIWEDMFFQQHIANILCTSDEKEEAKKDFVDDLNFYSPYTFKKWK